MRSATSFLTLCLALANLADLACGTDDTIFRVSRNPRLRERANHSDACVLPLPRLIIIRQEDLPGDRSVPRLQFETQLNSIIYLAPARNGVRFRDNSSHYEITQHILSGGRIQHTYRYFGPEANSDHYLIVDPNLRVAESRNVAQTDVGRVVVIPGHQAVTATYSPTQLAFLKFQIWHR